MYLTLYKGEGVDPVGGDTANQEELFGNLGAKTKESVIWKTKGHYQWNEQSGSLGYVDNFLQ